MPFKVELIVIVVLFVIAFIIYKFSRPDLTLIVNTQNLDKDYYLLKINIPTGDVPKKRYLITKVKIDKQPIEDYDEFL